MINKLVIFLIACMFASLSYSAYLRSPINYKMPSQYLLEKINIDAPNSAKTDNVISASNGDTTGVATTVSTGFTNPDVARILQVTPVGTTADVKAGNVVIYGTNIKGEAISDSLAVTENQSSATVGLKAFKTVSRVIFPAEDSPYTAQWSIGITDKLGLDACLDATGDVAWANFGGVFETTRPTITVHATDVSKNVVDPNSTLDDSSDLDVYYIHNFRCK